MRKNWNAEKSRKKPYKEKLVMQQRIKKAKKNKS